jgi:aspartyl-tRNA synthetase
MVQVVIDPDTPEAFALAEEVRSRIRAEDRGARCGRVPPAPKTPIMPTGMVELLTQDA